jgi:hypothetical protein
MMAVVTRIVDADATPEDVKTLEAQIRLFVKDVSSVYTSTSIEEVPETPALREAREKGRPITLRKPDARIEVEPVVGGEILTVSVAGESRDGDYVAPAVESTQS